MNASNSQKLGIFTDSIKHVAVNLSQLMCNRHRFLFRTSSDSIFSKVFEYFEDLYLRILILHVR